MISGNIWQRIERWLAVLLLAAAGAVNRATAQLKVPQYQEPQWLSMNIEQVDAGLYSEGTYEQTTYKNSGVSASHDYLFIGPSLGLKLDGSIYHPNLFHYYAASEGAFGWGQDNVNSGTTSTHRNEFQYLGWFASGADLLANKPLHLSVFANYDHSYQNYDFFNQVTVQGWRYGSRLAYESGPWTLSADYTHRDQTFTAISGTTSTIEDTADATLHNERQHGGTTLSYSFDQYTQTATELGINQSGTGVNNIFSAADAEQFGSHDQYRLTTSASYAERNSAPEPSQEFMANADLTAEHPHHLTSAYDFSYDNYTSGSYEADTYTAQAQVSHKLFDSLTSTFVLHGADFDTSDQGVYADTQRFGAGLIEDYTKSLSDDHRLHIGNSLFIDHTDQSTDQQGTTTIQNERHNFGESGALADSFYLNSPNVELTTIAITDVNHTQPGYMANFDYSVIQLGSRTQIQRLPGSRIPSGSPVLVGYTATSTASGSYDTLTESFEVRFDLWRHFLGVYGRLDLSLNNAPSQLLIQNVRAYTFGADLTWRWFRAGAEYQIYDGSQVAYTSTRLFQSLGFHLDEASTLNLDLTEGWINYTSVNQTQENYRAMARLHRTLTQRLGLDIAAGVALLNGAGVNEYLATFRPSIQYVIGKTTIDATYDYEYDMFMNAQALQQHLFMVRVKRVF